MSHKFKNKIDRKKYKISIIIPTFGRSRAFIKILDQIIPTIESLRYVLEIIIVDDNDKAEFKRLWLRKVTTSRKIKCLVTNHVGSAAARNYGIRSARGNILILYDDDVLPTKDSVMNHYQFHLKHSENYECLVGRTATSKDVVNSDPFTNKIDELQLQFAQKNRKGLINFKFFYTSNVSLKKEFLLEHGLFNEMFKDAVYEDIELAYRLEKKGFKIYFNPKNFVFHLKKYDLNMLEKRYKLMGIYAMKLIRIHPELLNSLIFIKPNFKEVILIIFNPILKLLQKNGIRYFEKLLIKSVATKSFFSGLKYDFNNNSHIQ